MPGALVTDEAAEALGAAADEPEGAADRRARRLRVSFPTALGPAPLGAVAILLERGGEEIEVERVPPAKAHRELLAQVPSPGRRSAGAFSAAARLAEVTPVALVTVPDRIDALPAAARELAELIPSDRVYPVAVRTRG